MNKLSALTLSILSFVLTAGSVSRANLMGLLLEKQPSLAYQTVGASWKKDQQAKTVVVYEFLANESEAKGVLKYSVFNGNTVRRVDGSADVLSFDHSLYSMNPSLVEFKGDLYLYFNAIDKLTELHRFARAKFNGTSFDNPIFLEVSDNLVGQTRPWLYASSDGQTVSVAYELYDSISHQNVLKYADSSNGIDFDKSNIFSIDSQMARVLTVDSETRLFLYQKGGTASEPNMANYIELQKNNSSKKVQMKLSEKLNVHDLRPLRKNDGSIDIYYIASDRQHYFSLYRRNLSKQMRLGAEEQLTQAGVNPHKPAAFQMPNGQIIVTFPNIYQNTNANWQSELLYLELDTAVQIPEPTLITGTLSTEFSAMTKQAGFDWIKPDAAALQRLLKPINDVELPFDKEFVLSAINQMGPFVAPGWQLTTLHRLPTTSNFVPSTDLFSTESRYANEPFDIAGAGQFLFILGHPQLAQLKLLGLPFDQAINKISLEERPDLGLIKSEIFKPNMLRVADNISLQEEVYIIHSPFLDWLDDASKNNFKLNQGPLVSKARIQKIHGTTAIIDAFTARGSSGGTVLNKRGEVVGVLSASIKGVKQTPLTVMMVISNKIKQSINKARLLNKQ